MFKKGEFIKGVAGNGYSDTANENLLKAEVTYTHGYPVVMDIKILEHTNPEYIGYSTQVENRETMFQRVPPLMCTIENGKFSYIMNVDGQEISFQFHSCAEYFAKHYADLGYVVVKEGWE